MKNLLKFAQIFTITSALVLTSCESESADMQAPEIEGVSEALKAKLDAFYLNGRLAERHVNQYPDGSSVEGIRVEDKFFTEDQINEMMDLRGMESIWSEQYRTNNLVSQPRTISVIGYTGGQFALSSRGRTGLQWAINNYNRLNLNIRFTLRFATATNADIVVFDNSVNNRGFVGGEAGFPFGGDPFKWVQIYGLQNSSNNENEHVIGHEIGHSIGFRHTDWFSRQTCPPELQGNEGTGFDGAIRIPGTPAGFDPNSIMLACFDSSVDGEFNANDITALRFMY